MTSEERHALKQNDLAAATNDLPGLWARHGNKALIALTVACLAFAAVRWRNSQNAQQEADGRQALANAWAGVNEMRQRTASPVADPSGTGRAPLENDINAAVGQVTGNDRMMPTQKAWAWLARGEMYWAIAHAASATPATRPATQPSGAASADPLTLAATAYETVVQQYVDVRGPATIARFALAAVAEERRDVAAARTQYAAVIETPDVSASDKSMATARLGQLDRIERPTLLLPASQPAVTPPTGGDPFGAFGLPPSLTGPLATPSTKPATPQPAATLPAGPQPAR